jgi:hypothetical protein
VTGGFDFSEAEKSFPAALTKLLGIREGNLAEAARVFSTGA